MPPTNEPTAQSTVNNVWASSPIGEAIEFLTLPSGQTCRAKRVGLEGMMAAGLLGEFDSLSSFVGSKHVNRVRQAGGNKVKEELSAQSMMKDPTALKKIILLVDRALPTIVVEPRVLSHVEIVTEADKADDMPETRSIPKEDREEGVVYTDQIGLEDKMYLFNYAVGGTRDLERFRSESASDVAGMAASEGVQHETQRPSGGRKQRGSRR